MQKDASPILQIGTLQELNSLDYPHMQRNHLKEQQKKIVWKFNVSEIQHILIAKSHLDAAYIHR